MAEEHNKHAFSDNQQEEPSLPSEQNDLFNTEQAQSSDQEPAPVKTPSKAALWMKRRCMTALNVIYRYFYFVGIQLLRNTRTRRRHLMQGLHQMEEAFQKRRRRRRHNWKLYGRSIWRQIITPFYETRDKYRGFRNQLRSAKATGSSWQTVKIYLHLLGLFFSRIWYAIRVSWRYVFPVIAIGVLVIAVQSVSRLSLVLRVEYDGRDLGYISDESVFDRAEVEMKNRIINEAYIKPEDIIPKFQLAALDTQGQLSGYELQFLSLFGFDVDVNASDLLTVDDLTNQLIQASGNALEQADGLYIQDQFISAVTDGTGLLLHLNELREAHRTEDMGQNTQIEFLKKIQVKRGLYPVSSITSLDQLKEYLSREEKGEKRYTVISGDDGLKIAAKNGITFAELKALNPNVDIRLMPGDELLISQSVPFMQVQIKTTVKIEEEIDFAIKQQTDPTQPIGYTKIKQTGEKGLREITAEIIMIDGVETQRNEISSNVVQPAVEQILVVGGNKPLKVIPSNSSGSVPSGAFAWPTIAGRISPGFLGYYGHTGADISWSGCTGAAVLASADGTVVASGWGGAYGYRVIINHGGNLQTLYAHCSKLYVSVGQQVKQGETIGAIGRTGNTTGPHLHFEVRVGGVPVNPAPYLYS